MKPPTFFLSSTIYDFKDLRSAIKYYLEQQGCRVLASDFNDFAKPLDKHSYEACIKAIGLADYFVLLVGARVGGWYDESNQVSITQQEYREAYRLHKEGRIKLLNFVRAEVWRMKDDRKFLAKHLETLDLDPGAKSQILRAPSKAATDAEFIVRFIEEIGKNRETAAATKGKGPLPTGNWLHQFETFKDIIEQLQVQAFSGQPIAEVAFKRLLRQEMMELLRSSLVKRDGGVVTNPRKAIETLHSMIPTNVNAPMDELQQWSPTVRMSKANYLLIAQAWALMGSKAYFPHILSEAVASPVFTEFDSATGGLKVQPVHGALVRLMTDFKRTALLDLTMIGKEVGEHLSQLTNEAQFIEVSKIHLMLVMAILERWANTVNLCRAIVKHLDGEPFVMPVLVERHLNLFPGNEADKTVPSTSDAEWFLKLPDR